MLDLFSETSRQFGLSVGLLVVAVVILARAVYVLNRDLHHRTDKELAEKQSRIEELEIEVDLYRERWIEAIGAAEVGKEATRRLAKSARR